MWEEQFKEREIFDASEREVLSAASTDDHPVVCGDTKTGTSELRQIVLRRYRIIHGWHGDMVSVIL